MLKELQNQYKNGEVLCLVDLTMRVIGGKWKAIIIWHIGEQKILRYGEIKKLLGKISPKMLTQQLRELESCGLINRKVYNQIPPKVEYSLSKKGESIRPILKQMCDWSMENIIDCEL